LLFLAALPALAFSEPIIMHQVACHSTTKAVLYNGTVLELPSLKPLAQLGPIEGCDVCEGYGERIAVWRGGQVEVYDGLRKRLTVQGERAFIGMRFAMVTARDFVAVYSLYGFQVLRLDNRTIPVYVRLLGAGEAGSKAVLLITPTLCKVRMQVESYLLVYDLDLGLWDIHQTGAVSIAPLPSGALWVKNGTLYHNGQAIGEAPDRVYPVSSFDGYAYTQGGKVVIVAMNGSTYTLPLPGGRDLAVSRLSEGFVACSSYQCTCTFNCTGFTEVARQAHAPPVATETETHYLLYANTVLYILEKPKPASTAPSSTPPSSQAPANTATPQNNTPTAQPPASITAPRNNATPVGNTPPSPQNPTASAGSEGLRQDAGRGPSTPPAILLVAGLAALALLGYVLYKKRHRYIA
jgi:hypothetical protein